MSDKPATESRSGGVQSQVVWPSRSDGTSRTKTGPDRHHRRSRDEDQCRDRYSSNRGSSRHSSERRRSPHHHSSDHRRPSSSSGRSSDRGRERNSTSRAATPIDSRHHDSTGQQGSSWWSRAEGRDSGSTAQPAASSLSRRETTSRADPSDHPGSSQQARDVVQRIIRYLRLRPHAGVRPQIDLNHPAVVRYILSTYLRSLQSQFHQPTSGHGQTPWQMLPTRHSFLAQQTRPIRHRVPTQLGRGAWVHTWGAALPTRHSRPVAPACRAWMGRPGRSHQHVLTQQALLTRHRTSLQLGHTVSPCHVWCHGIIILHQIRCQWHISVQQATKMYRWIRRLLFSRPFPSTSTRCSLLNSWLWWI